MLPLSWKRLALVLILCTLQVFFSPPPVLAQTKDNFDTDLRITYAVNANGQTQVTHTIDLTNKTPTMYASQYSLKVGSPNIKNIRVTSNGSAITPTITTTTTQTNIEFQFPDQLVGEGKKRSIELNYTHPDASIISGKILEVQVPKLSSVDTYDSYQVTLITPAQFGAPTRVTPNKFESTISGNTITTRFVPTQGESVTALFGQHQIFDLKLRYPLQNSSANTSLAQIALPPDTAFQKMVYESLEPKPKKMERDSDGNWIATYELPPQTTTTVNLVAKTWISLQPATAFPTTQPSSVHTAAQVFWETTDPQIIQLANNYNTPRAIYDHVVEVLTYDESRNLENTPRLGAVESLKRPALAVCMEFTDLFIAIARAAKIPSRKLTGYAYTANSQLRPLSLEDDSLHAWPEYFDTTKQQWTPVDPTWGNTTGGVNYFDQFDLNHIVFAINGASSTTPYPAGSYKTQNVADNNVEVSFADTFHQPEPAFSLSKVSKRFGIPGNNQLTLINKSGQAWYNVSLTTAANSGVNLSLPKKIPVVLPYESVELTLPAYSSELLGIAQLPVALELTYTPDDRNQTTTANAGKPPTAIQLEPVTLSVGPQLLQAIQTPYGLLGLGVGGAILAVGAGSLLVFGRPRSRSVRRKG